MKAYLDSLKQLENLDEGVSLIQSVDDHALNSFLLAFEKVKSSSVLICEFADSFEPRLQHVSPEISIINISSALSDWNSTFDALRDQAVEESKSTIELLHTKLRLLMDIDIGETFFFDKERIQITLREFSRRCHETTALSRNSFAIVGRSVAFVLVQHAKNHICELLESSKDEALSLLEDLSSKELSFESIPSLMESIRAINDQIHQDALATINKLEAIATEDSFAAVLPASATNAFAGFQRALTGLIRERELESTKSAAVELVMSHCGTTFSALKQSEGLRQFFGGDTDSLAFKVAEHISFEEITVALNASAQLIDPIVNGVATLIQESIASLTSIINENYFIGSEAFSFRQELNAQLAAAVQARAQFPELWAPKRSVRISSFLRMLNTLDRLLPLLVKSAEATPGRVRSLSQLSTAYDIPNVIEDVDEKPVGLISRAYGGESVWRIPLRDNLRTRPATENDSGRCICISFPAGIIPTRLFSIQLTPETIFGDWLRWWGGGFLFRDKPQSKINLPKSPARLGDFLKVHVFRQWTGGMSVQEFAERMNRAARNHKNDCELYFSQVSDNLPV